MAAFAPLCYKCCYCLITWFDWTVTSLTFYPWMLLDLIWERDVTPLSRSMLPPAPRPALFFEEDVHVACPALWWCFLEVVTTAAVVVD